MKKILLILSVLTCVVSRAQELPGFFLDDWQPKSIVSPAFADTNLNIGKAPVIVSVDFNDTITKVSKYVFGNNGNPYSGRMNKDATLLKYLNDLNPNVIRWPGGNISQVYFWDRSTRPTDIPPNPFDFWAGKSNMTNNDYYELLSLTHSTGSICVNVAYARYGRGPNPINTAAHYAAEWVRFDNGRSKFWELGNENFGSWEAGYSIDTAFSRDDQPEIISGTLYGNICSVFIDSMRAAAADVGADIKIGAVALDQNVTYDAVQQHWNEQMMPILADKIDFIVVHSYYTPYNENSTVETILNSPSVTTAMVNYINEGLSDAGHGSMPMALTEWNIFAIGSMQAVSYINGMQSAINAGELIKNKYGMACKWDISNGWGGTGDDHGMFASSDETGVPFRNPHPQFHYMYFFQRYFGDCMVKSTVSGNDNVLAYASSFSSGQVGIVLANKSRYEQKVKLDLENFISGRHMYYYLLTGGTDNGDFSRKVYINGQGPSIIAGGPSNYASIKPWGIAIDDSVKFNMPPLSVIYALIDPADQPDIKSARLINDSIVEVKLTSAVLIPDTAKGFSVFMENAINDSVKFIQRDVVDSTILFITIATPVSNTDSLYLSYIDGNFVSYAGKSLLNAERVNVQNLLTGSTPLLLDAYTDASGSKVYLKFNKKMQIPPEASFGLNVHFLNEQSVVLKNAALLGTDSLVMEYTSDKPLFYDYDLTLIWNDSDITSADGGKLISTGTLPVKNFSPVKSGEILSAYTTASGDSIFLEFDKSLVSISGLTTKFNVTVDGASNGLKKVVFQADDAKILILVLKNKILSNNTDILLSYSGTTLQTYDAAQVKVFDNLQVVNNSTATVSNISETADNYYSIYPNPARDELTIESESLINTIAIYSVDGRKVFEKYIESGCSEISIPINLQSGTYIIRIGDNKMVQSSVIVID